MRSLLISLSFLFTASVLSAQDNTPYAEKAAQLQKEIWGTQVPEFKATTVPANLNKESAVILAHSYSLQRTSNGRVKFMIITAASTTHTVKLSTLHERIKINDKVALEAYSTLEYQKKLDKTVSLLITKFVNTHNTYIGAKIIKPDGKEVIVNTGEEVLLKNEVKDQKGKLAIPGLQVGDILDYYISTAEINESSQGDSYKDNDNLFMLADEYPVLYYSLDFQFNKKTNVQYIYANGAPHFEESHNDAGDLLLSLKIRNMAKYESQLWISPLRQYPYIEIGSSFTNKFNMAIANQKGEDNSSRFAANKKIFESAFMEYPGFDEPEKRLKSYFDSHKALKNAPTDSVLKVLYDEWKFMVFCTYEGNELENINEMNYRTARSVRAASTMSMMLTDLGIDHDVLLVASRNSNTLENVYNLSDFDAMIRINNGTTPAYMCFDDVVTHYNEIPARFQGESATVLRSNRHNARYYSFSEQGTATLPVAASDKNRVEEQLEVSLLPGSMQKLKIERHVKQWGELRHSDQKQLLPVDEIDNGYKNMVKGEELNKRLSKVQQTKKMKDDYQYSFTQEHMQMSKNFTAEIKGQFDQEPEQVDNCKIINNALESTNPVFQYSSSFVLNNLVKKAGNNYIIDAGKLTGSFYKLEDKDRKRNVDVYMHSSRSFKYTISITIPQGYSAKGMEEMNVRKTNKTGSFSSTASVNGNILTILVTRVYNNNFEKVAEWPLLVDLIDTASNFNNQKILLEKKG